MADLTPPAADPIAEAGQPTQPGKLPGEELPDTSMLWRRVISTGLILVLLAMTFRESERISDPARLHSIIRYLVGFAVILSGFYFAGATITDWVNVINAVRAKRAILDSQGAPKP